MYENENCEYQNILNLESNKIYVKLTTNYILLLIEIQIFIFISIN